MLRKLSLLHGLGPKNHGMLLLTSKLGLPTAVKTPKTIPRSYVHKSCDLDNLSPKLSSQVILGLPS